VVRKVEPSRALMIQKRNRYFAGGSVSEFCELSGEGKIRSPSPPVSRDSPIDPPANQAIFASQLQRAGGFILTYRTGDQREVSDFLFIFF
jgi:hypothetical protein